MMYALDQLNHEAVCIIIVAIPPAPTPHDADAAMYARINRSTERVAAKNNHAALHLP
jgi:hypothetical protein